MVCVLMFFSRGAMSWSVIVAFPGNTHLLFGTEMALDSCADPESFVKGGPTLTTFFFKVDEEKKDPHSTISGPSSARQQNAI